MYREGTEMSQKLREWVGVAILWFLRPLWLRPVAIMLRGFP